LKSPQLPPDKDQDQDELPDEPRREADQQRFSERVIAPELISEPRSDEPGEDAHRDGRRRPHREDLSERVLPYGFIPIDLVRRLFHQPNTETNL
jgi:hypothetical protein